MDNPNAYVLFCALVSNILACCCHVLQEAERGLPGMYEAASACAMQRDIHGDVPELQLWRRR